MTDPQRSFSGTGIHVSGDAMGAAHLPLVYLHTRVLDALEASGITVAGKVESALLFLMVAALFGLALFTAMSSV